MKQSENLSQLSDEQVSKNLKRAKAMFIAFIIIFIILVATCIYISATKGLGVFTFLPFAFIPILIANIFNFGKIKEEAKNRNLM